MTLRLGIDAHVIGRPTGGNERVMKNLVPALRAVCDHELFAYVDAAAAARETWPSAPCEVRALAVENPLLRLAFSLPKASRDDRLDAMLCLYNRPALVACPVVTVVHDVSFARFPSYFSRYERTYMNLTIPGSMRRSAGVVTDSEFSRGEIEAVYGIPNRRITVAHHGIDPAFQSQTETKRPFDFPYFLAIGSSQPRKNLLTVVRAYARVLETMPELSERLVITRPEPTEGELATAIAPLRETGRIVFTGRVDDAGLSGLYAHATAFLYASVYEGFGLPPLEAMACGAPALVADIPVMREVAGDAALRLPATDVGAWTDGLRAVASDAALRDRLVAAGRERTARFTWDRSARAVIGALESAT